MKRMLCLLLVLVMLLSLCVQAFADNDVLYCRMCGRRIPTDSRVCPYCGVEVVHIEEDAKASGKNTKATKETPKPAETAAPVQESPAPVQAAASAAATDVKTAQAQNAVASPVTQAVPSPSATPVPGPFNTTLSTNNTSSAKVYITKSPTSESVPYGGSCAFIAHAANATSITWYIASSDGSLICAASDAPYSVSGLYVSGANSDTLYLSGIPSWWNGCQVQACFTGEGGPVYTDIARIWTYQPAPEVKSSGWSYWDWFNYLYWDDPDLPEIPWWYWYYLWGEDAPNPPDVQHAITLPGGQSIAPELPGPGTPGSPAIHVGHQNPLDPEHDFDFTKPTPTPKPVATPAAS